MAHISRDSDAKKGKEAEMFSLKGQIFDMIVTDIGNHSPGSSPSFILVIGGMVLVTSISLTAVGIIC